MGFFRRSQVVNKNILVKVQQQLLALKKYLRFYPWRLSVQKNLPWYLVLASDAQLASWWIAMNFKDFSWRSVIAEYNAMAPHVNLYVAAQAVLLEAPPQFWQQAQIEFNLWHDFCVLLQRQCYGQPLEGVIVLVDFALLMDVEALQKFLGALRAALAELSAFHLTQLVVYFFVVGLERLLGFEPYIQHLRPEQKQQVFGVTFGVAKNQQVNLDDFEQLFQTLLRRLDQRLISQLQRHQPALFNAEILHFPLVFAAHKHRFKQLLVESSYAASMHNKILVRGCYFMSQQAFVTGPFTQVLKHDAVPKNVRRFLFFFTAFHKKLLCCGLAVIVLVLVNLGLMLTRSKVVVSMPAPILAPVVKASVPVKLFRQPGFFDKLEQVPCDLQWTPLYLSKNLALFQLHIGQQYLFYQNGPRMIQVVHWSGQEVPIRLEFLSLTGQRWIQTYQGTHGLIQLLRNAKLHPLGANAVRVTFSAEGYSATYVVRVKSRAKNNMR
jgi:type VI protein secretion system component VasK